MIDKLLQPEVQQFIEEHLNDDVVTLLLKRKEVCGVPTSLIADQITGKRKAAEKLSLYYNTSGIIYPPAINWSQCSSEQTAEYKAQWLKAKISDFKKGVDLTGGFGVDAFFIGKLFQQYVYIDPNDTLLHISRHNHLRLGAKQLVYKNITAEAFTDQLSEEYDFMYIDPSRRDESNKKLVRLSDCVPDVTALQEKLLQYSTVLLVKTSPLLDIQQGLRELKHVKEVVILSVDNECKEVLFWCERDFQATPEIVAVNLYKTEEEFRFNITEESSAIVAFSEPKNFIYEPNVSVFKAGAFKCIANRYQLYKLHVNTHLYTSDSFVSDFPGRVFEVRAIVKSDPKTVAEYFKDGKANVITRNYPVSPEELKKKLKLTDGSEQYLIAFTGVDKKYTICASRLK